MDLAFLSPIFFGIILIGVLIAMIIIVIFKKKKNLPEVKETKCFKKELEQIQDFDGIPTYVNLKQPIIFREPIEMNNAQYEAICPRANSQFLNQEHSYSGIVHQI